MYWLLVCAALYVGGFYLPYHVGLPCTVLGILLTLWRISRWVGFGTPDPVSGPDRLADR